MVALGRLRSSKIRHSKGVKLVNLGNVGEHAPTAGTATRAKLRAGAVIRHGICVLNDCGRRLLAGL